MLQLSLNLNLDVLNELNMNMNNAAGNVAFLQLNANFFHFVSLAFRFCYAAVFVLTLLSCRSDGELEPMTVQCSPWHF